MAQEQEFDFDREKLSQKLLSEYLKEEDALPDQEHERQKWARMRRVLLIAAGVLTSAFFIFAWQTDKFALTASQVDSLPLVRADKTPVKIKPDDPGGIKVANMDKSIFSSIDDDKDKELPKVTRILPAPEKPVKRAEIALRPLKNEIIEAPESVKKEENVEVEKTIEPEAKPEPLENTEVESKKIAVQAAIPEKKEPTIEDVIGDALKDIKPEDIQPTPVPRRKALVVPQDAAKDSGHRIQLGAYRTVAEAEERWKKISTKFAAQLQDKKHYVEKADLGSKGIFYRLQVGSLASVSEGRSICNELTAKKQGCFIVK